MHCAAPLCLVLSAHPGLPTLLDLVQVCKVAKGYYLLTEPALRRWRALRVVVTHDKCLLGVRQWGELLSACCHMHTLFFCRPTRHRHLASFGEEPWPMVILEDYSGSEETYTSNEEDDWI